MPTGTANITAAVGSHPWKKIIRTSDNIRLGVAFEHPDPIFKKEIDGVCYYPIRVKPGLRRRIYASEKRQDNYCGLPEKS